MYGYFPAVRGSLMKRGWVEKILHTVPYMNPHPNNCVCSHAGWHPSSPTVTPTGTIPPNLMPSCASHTPTCENNVKKQRSNKSKPNSAVNKKPQNPNISTTLSHESNSDDDEKSNTNDIETCINEDQSEKESNSASNNYSEASTVKMEDKTDLDSLNEETKTTENESVNENNIPEDKNSFSKSESNSSSLSSMSFSGSIDLKDEIKVNHVIDNQSSIYETTKEQEHMQQQQQQQQQQQLQQQQKQQTTAEKSTNSESTVKKEQPSKPRLDDTNSELKVDIQVIGRKDNINTAMLGPYEIRKGLAQSINEKNVSLFQYTVPIYEKRKVKRVPVIEKIKEPDPEMIEKMKKEKEEKERKQKELEEKQDLVEQNDENEETEGFKPYPDLDYEITDLDLPLVARLLRNVEPNLIWTWTKESISFKHIGRDQTVNRFPNTPFTTKVQYS